MKFVKIVFLIATVSVWACSGGSEGADSAIDGRDLVAEYAVSMDSIRVIYDSLYEVRSNLNGMEILQDPLLALKVQEFDTHMSGINATFEHFEKLKNDVNEGIKDLEQFEASAIERKNLALYYIQEMKKIAFIYFNPDIPN